MISMTSISTISMALNQCDLTQSGDDLLILDRHGEILGRVSLDEGGVRVFESYEYRAQVVSRLKYAGIPCSCDDPAADALNVLYNTPRETPD